MITVEDKATGEVREYEDFEDMREGEKKAFDRIVHKEVNRLVDELEAGNPTNELEAYLCVEVR